MATGSKGNAVGVYSIRDMRAGVYGPVFTAPNDAVAARMFTESIVPDTLPFRYPEDFVLFHLGVLDQEEGLVNAEGFAVSSPVRVVGAVDVKRGKE